MSENSGSKTYKWFQRHVSFHKIVYAYNITRRFFKCVDASFLITLPIFNIFPFQKKEWKSCGMGHLMIELDQKANKKRDEKLNFRHNLFYNFSSLISLNFLTRAKSYTLNSMKFPFQNAFRIKKL